MVSLSNHVASHGSPREAFMVRQAHHEGYWSVGGLLHVQSGPQNAEQISVPCVLTLQALAGWFSGGVVPASGTSPTVAVPPPPGVPEYRPATGPVPPVFGPPTPVMLISGSGPVGRGWITSSPFTNESA